MHKTTIQELINKMRYKKLRIVTAESLTCGNISKVLTSVSGASDVVNGGFSVYQDEMKMALLDVRKKTLDQNTAVSASVAFEMAVGALKKTSAKKLGKEKASDIAIAVTGYASSPRGLANEEECGLVYIAIASNFNKRAFPDVDIHEHRFKGDRDEVRNQTTDTAINYVRELIK